MPFPTFLCEAAFGSNPNDSPLNYTVISDGAGVASSARLRSFSFTRGRQYELNQMSMATGTGTLRNKSREFDPTYSGSPYYPNVVPVTPMRLSGDLGGTVYRIFTMFASRWPQTQQGPRYAESPVEWADGFDLLQNAILPGATYPQELSGARVSRVLDAAGWSSTARNIGTGDSEISPYTFATSDGVQALTHLLAVAEQSEIGYFFISRDGNATFIDRHTSLATTSQATFSDQSDDGGAIPYQGIVKTVDRDLIYNDWIGTRTGGATQEALNSTMIARYGRRSQTRTPLLTSDAEVMSSMQFLLSQYQQPALRIQSITIQPGDSSLAWEQVLGRDIGDRITVRSHPPGGGDPIVQDSFIQQINLSVDTHAGKAKCVWQLLPASILGYWFAGYSKVGTDTRAGY